MVRAATIHIPDLDCWPCAVEVDVTLGAVLRCQILDQRVVAAVARNAVRHPALARVVPARDADKANARADLNQRTPAVLAAQTLCGEVSVHRAVQVEAQPLWHLPYYLPLIMTLVLG